MSQLPAQYWLFVLLTLLLTIMVSYGTMATSRLLQTWKPDRNLLLMPAENGLRLALVPLLILFGFISGLPHSKLGWMWTDIVTESLVGFLWGLSAALFFFLATFWLHKFDIDGSIYSTTIIDAIMPRNKVEGVLVCLAMVPAVIVEELLFRSLLLGGFQPLLPSAFLLALSSLLFGLLHLPQGRWGVIGATGAGCLFGLLFIHRANILVPIVAHYVANVLQIGLASRWYRPPSTSGVKPNADEPPSEW